MQTATSKTTHPAAAVATAASRVSLSPSQLGQTNKRKEPYAASGDPHPSNPKKVKSFDEVQQEVRLKTYVIMGPDEAAKINALQELAKFASAEEGAYNGAMGDWGCCHLVLIVLHHELAKEATRNREVVYHAIRFLTNWSRNGTKQCNEMSRCEGTGSIIKAMRTYADDSGVQYVTICWLLNYSSDKDEKRLREIVNGDGVPCILHAMSTFREEERLVKHSVNILDRICDASNFKGEIFGGEGVQRIVRVMKAFRYDKVIVLHCAKILDRLSDDANHIIEMFGGNGVPRIVQALNTFNNDKDIVLYILKILDRLFDAANLNGRRHLIKEGILVALSLVIGTHMDSDEIVLKRSRELMTKLCAQP